MTIPYLLSFDNGTYDGIYKYWSIYGYHFYILKWISMFRNTIFMDVHPSQLLWYLYIENIDPWPMRKKRPKMWPMVLFVDFVI